jgi:hypothetical protein
MDDEPSMDRPVTRPARNLGARIACGVYLLIAAVAACAARTTESRFDAGPEKVDAGCEAGVVKDRCPCTEPDVVICGFGKGHRCVAGTWSFFFDGECDPRDARPEPTIDAALGCPADPDAALGGFCETAGLVCASCADPCSCSVIRCEFGKWVRVQAPGSCDAGSDG